MTNHLKISPWVPYQTRYLGPKRLNTNQVCSQLQFKTIPLHGYVGRTEYRLGLQWAAFMNEGRKGRRFLSLIPSFCEAFCCLDARHERSGHDSCFCFQAVGKMFSPSRTKRIGSSTQECLVWELQGMTNSMGISIGFVSVIFLLLQMTVPGNTACTQEQEGQDIVDKQVMQKKFAAMALPHWPHRIEHRISQRNG